MFLAGGISPKIISTSEEDLSDKALRRRENKEARKRLFLLSRLEGFIEFGGKDVDPKAAIAWMRKNENQLRKENFDAMAALCEYAIEEAGDDTHQVDLIVDLRNGIQEQLNMGENLSAVYPFLTIDQYIEGYETNGLTSIPIKKKRNKPNVMEDLSTEEIAEILNDITLDSEIRLLTPLINKEITGKRRTFVKILNKNGITTIRDLYNVKNEILNYRMFSGHVISKILRNIFTILDPQFSEINKETPDQANEKAETWGEEENIYEGGEEEDEEG